MQKQFPWSAFAAAVLLFSFATQAVLSMYGKSVTVDEITYITAGYYHWNTGDFHYNATNPPFVKLLAAAPLLVLNPTLAALPAESFQWGDIETWKYAREFFFSNDVDADKMLFFARLPIVAVGVLVGLCVYLWSGALFGQRAALVSLFLYVFCPNMLAHSRLATQDVGLTAFVLITAYGLWSYTEHPKLKTLVLSGVSLGLGIATKTTMLFVAPAIGLYVLVRLVKSPTFAIHQALPFVQRVASRRPRSGQVVSLGLAGVIVAAVAIFTLNISYGFQGTFDSIGSRYAAKAAQQVPAEKVYWRGVAKKVVFAAPTLFPSAYLDGLAYQRKLGRKSARVFFAGHIYESGRWYLILMSVLLKTPLPALFLAACLLGVVVVRGVRSNAEWLLLSIVAVFLGCFAVMSNLSGNLRYVLPIYPIMYILIGRLAVEVPRNDWVKVLTVVLAVWYVGCALWIHPHYLAYVNESVGGPSQGYKYLAESNIDWGQDLKGLKRYMDEHDIKRIQLGYFGSAEAAYYGIQYDYLPSVGLAPQKPGEYWWYDLNAARVKPVNLQPGLVAISANLISGPQWIGPLFGDTYSKIRDLEPIDSVGYSILIYQIP